MDKGIPPHMNPFTPGEVQDLLRTCMVGPLPTPTVQRLLATVTAWLPVMEALPAVHVKSEGDCCGTTDPTMLDHEPWCEHAHLDMEQLLRRMDKVMQDIEANRAVLVKRFAT